MTLINQVVDSSQKRRSGTTQCILSFHDTKQRLKTCVFYTLPLQGQSKDAIWVLRR